MKNLKKSFVIALTAIILISSSAFATARNIKIMLNGNEIKADVAPFIKDNRTLVPIRLISESLKYNVNWDEKNRIVSIDKDGLNIKLKIDSNDVQINNVKKKTDVAPIIKDSRTFVPIRFISETFGLNVKWDDNSSTVIIDNEKYDLSNLTEDEKNYVKLITNFKEINASIMTQIKPYFFEDANKYSKEEIKNKYNEFSNLLDNNIVNITNINVPEKFKESHDFLLQSIAASKLILKNYNDGLIEDDKEASKKIIALYTDYSVKKSEADKALENEIKGIKYVADKDIATYNNAAKDNGNTNLLEDPVIKNLFSKIQ